MNFLVNIFIVFSMSPERPEERGVPVDGRVNLPGQRSSCGPVRGASLTWFKTVIGLTENP
ncbi:MAG: hypothetical protein LCH89_15045 [Proteobacteria bacterium]|nr:hypothetical protein [Pseudomonadota bacterium]